MSSVTNTAANMAKYLHMLHTQMFQCAIPLTSAQLIRLIILKRLM